MGIYQPAASAQTSSACRRRHAIALWPGRNVHITELDLESLRADPEGGVFYVDEIPVAAAVLAQEQSEPFAVAAAVPISPFPAGLVFHSKPGAPNVLYLNFTGETVKDTAWNTSVGRTTITAVAFSSDSDFTTFSDAEQSVIRRVWQRVAEDYAPFNIDVTTERPSSFGARTAHALITRNTDNGGSQNPASTAGGVAYMGVFATSSYASYRPAWIYNNNLANEESYIAEAVSHEIGHNLGLSHDGKKDGSEYYSGHGSGDISWAPIMGASYNRQVSQWSKGEYYQANNTQDDLATIAAKISYRTDDHGNTLASATPLVVSSAGTVQSTTPQSDPANSNPANKGALERNTDVDMFSFAAGTGPLSLTITPWTAGSALTRGGNVDLLVQLYDSSGNVLLANNASTLTHATIQTNLVEGVYYIAIRNSGAGDPASATPTGYTSYGSIGQFFISGSMTPSGVVIPPGAELEITDITQPGVASKQFAITYSDNAGIDVSTLDGNDIIVTGPNGFRRGATLVAVDQLSNGSPRVATYAVSPPSANWTEVDNGTYTVSVQAGEVRDVEGAFVPARELGQFDVAIPRLLYFQSMASHPGWIFEGLWQHGVPRYPSAGPTSGFTGASIVGYNLSGNYENRLPLTFATTPPINCSGASSITLRLRRWLRLKNGDTATIQVSANGGAWATVWSTTRTVSDSSWQEVQYSLPSWAAGSSSVQLRWGIASGPSQNEIGWNIDDVALLGNGTLDTIQPIASLNVANLTSAGSPTHDFTVTYSDNVAVTVASLGSSDLVVVAPNGSTNQVEFVGVDTPGDGALRIATYSMAAPQGLWQSSDNGVYQVFVQDAEVIDTSNNAIDETLLGAFSVAISASRQNLVVEPTSLSVPEGGTASFTIRLAEQPSAPVTVAMVSVNGDADLTLASGATHTFSLDNWSTPARVVLAGAQDADQENGTALFECRSDGLASVSVIATEQDNTASNPGEQPMITAIRPTGESIVIEVSGITGVLHVLEASDDLRTWTTVGAETPVAAIASFLLKADGSHRFFRVVVP